MMMKYHWKYKISFFVIIGLTMTFWSPAANIAWAISSAVIESFSQFGANVTDSRARLFAKNRQLQMLLAQSQARQLNLANQLIRQQPQQPQQLQIPSFTKADSPEIATTLTSDIVTPDNNLVARVTLAALPLFNTNLVTNYSARIVALESDQYTEDLYVTDNNFLLGKTTDFDSKKIFTWSPFTANQDTISGTLPDQTTINITILSPFRYQITLPVSVTAPDGLFEADTKLLLGIKTESIIANDNQIITYALPWLPRLNDSLQIINTAAITTITTE